MKAPRGDVAVLVAGLLVLAILAFVRDEASRAQGVPSVYSTYDTGPNGYRALYAVLLQADVPVRRFQRVLGLLNGDVGTLIVSSYAGEAGARGLDAHDASALRRFVRSGGRLVALDSDFEGSNDLAPAVGASVKAQARDAIAVAGNRFTAGVRRVRTPIDAVFPSHGRGTVLLAAKTGAVAVAYAYGKGQVVAITAPRLFSNASLLDADNLAFAYNAVAGHGPAAFDEYVHGYDDDLGFWQALPAPVHAAFWMTCAIALLALIGANLPFAPPLSLSRSDERTTSAYVDAMAVLMRRAHAARAVLALFAADAARRIRDGRESKARAGAAELERLRDLPRPTDAAVLRASRIDFQLRKDIP